MGPVTTDGLVPPAPAARVVMEGPMGPSAPEMAVRTGTTIQVAEPVGAPTAATAAVRCLAPPVVGAVPAAIRPAAPALVPPIRPPSRPILGTSRVAHAGPRPSHATAVVQAPIEALRPVLVTGRRTQPVGLAPTAEPRLAIGSVPACSAPVTQRGPGTGTRPPLPVASRAMERAPTEVAAATTRASTGGVRTT